VILLSKILTTQSWWGWRWKME